MGREELIASLCKDLSGVFVEVGTCWGGFAEFLVKNTALTKLYCVDPYALFAPEKYLDGLNFQTTQEDLNLKFLMVTERLTSTNKVTMIRSTSYDGAKFIKEPLSFVYIDGNHSNSEVLRDLVAWWPKIRPGGLLAGDDVENIDEPHTDGDLFINRGGQSFGLYGVATALQDFAVICPNFHYTIVDNQFYAWKQ